TRSTSGTLPPRALRSVAALLTLTLRRIIGGPAGAYSTGGDGGDAPGPIRFDARARRLLAVDVMHRLVLLLALALPQVAGAVTAVFDPAGSSFYDLPFPHELRRDADGTVSLAGFPNPSGSALVASYLASMDQTEGFGRNSGVFFKLDGAIDPTSLPADAEAS